MNSALRRLAQRPAAQERCDLCGEPLPPQHRHVLDLDTGRPECACRGCAILFDRDAAGGGHYRLIPERRVALGPLDDRMLAALGIPVDLAFITVGAGGVSARYPSPAGLIASAPPPGAWELPPLQPDVEALLLSRRHGHWIVPIDDCFRLAARLREHWTGFTGGSAVWHEIDRFFDELEETP